jgi:hypothetical protein
MGSWRMGTRKRFAALLILAAFLAACTRQEVRPPVEERYYRIDWERSGAPVLEARGLHVRGLLLTPSQWPLEGSLKRLFQGDFIGVFEAFNLRFRSSTIPAGALEDLYSQGFVPAFVRVENSGKEPQLFSPPDVLTVRDLRGADLWAASPEELPETTTKMDWVRTGLAVAGVALLVAALASGKGGNIDLRLVDAAARSGGKLIAVSMQPGETGPTQRDAALPTAPADRSLLGVSLLAPGEAREGVLLFRHRNLTVDWATAQLALR